MEDQWVEPNDYMAKARELWRAMDNPQLTPEERQDTNDQWHELAYQYDFDGDDME